MTATKRGLNIDDWAVGWNPPCPDIDDTGKPLVSVRKRAAPDYLDWQRKFFCLFTATQLGNRMTHADKVAHLLMLSIRIIDTGINPRLVQREFWKIEAYRRVARAQICGMLQPIGTESPAAMAHAEADRQHGIRGMGGEFIP